MDMFLDKLAQKRTAQEIIKANTTAETEELKDLRGQVEGYQECLTKMQAVLADSAKKLEDISKQEASQQERLVEESIKKIQAVGQDTAKLQAELLAQMKTMQDALERKLDQTNAENVLAEKLEQLQRTVATGLAQDQTKKAILEQIASMQETLVSKLEEESSAQFADKMAELDENIHKECVKVYRNVQAVVVEENAKQAEIAQNSYSKVSGMEGKITAILGIAVGMLVLSGAGVLLQVLDMLNFRLF